MFRKSESGQVIVILALALVGLLGFSALAIDGSMVFADRRFSQSGADAAALAGAGAALQKLDSLGIDYTNFACGMASVPTVESFAENSAVQRAKSNQFTIDTDIVDGNGVDVTCGQPVGSDGFDDKYFEVRVKITSVTKTAFAQILFPNGLKNTVEAVARVRPRKAMDYGFALVALGNQCGNPNANTGGMDFNGNISTFVTGGGIWSNTCIGKTGNSGTVVVQDTAPVGLLPGRAGLMTMRWFMGNFSSISSVGVYALTDISGINHPATISPLAVRLSGVTPMPKYNIPEPDCASLPTYGAVTGGTINPGNYTSIITSNITMNPGLYCVSGSFKVSGDDVSGAGVTIFLTAPNGSFDMSGNVDLSAPTSSGGSGIKGLLVYQQKNNTHEIKMEGNGGTNFRGTLYAPDATIDIGGNAQVPYATQIIVNQLKFHGTADVYLYYDESFGYQFPPVMEMNK